MILTLRDPVGAWQSTMPTALKNWNGGESEIFSCQRSPQMTLLKTTDDCPVSVPLPLSAITDYFHVYCLCQLPPPTQTIHCWWCAWNLNYRGTFGGEALILTLFILSYRTTSDMLEVSPDSPLWDVIHTSKGISHYSQAQASHVCQFTCICWGFNPYFSTQLIVFVRFLSAGSHCRDTDGPRRWTARLPGQTKLDQGPAVTATLGHHERHEQEKTLLIFANFVWKPFQELSLLSWQGSLLSSICCCSCDPTSIHNGQAHYYKTFYLL